MESTSNVINIENRLSPPFFNKTQLVIERGEGVYAWDENGVKYLDFTSGWGVACLGHAHPVITEALLEQSRKIIQNPNSGLTYSPPRARLLSLMSEILPPPLTRVFFSNSGAEANDAALKLARKITGRPEVISARKSFHGRTAAAVSATGQMKHREKFQPLMPGHKFVPYNDLQALKEALSDKTAAVILEPIQGEGGVNLPKPGYLEETSSLCRANNSYLILDEVQTGFCRTGPMFAVSETEVKADFLTMAKGIAGGFPLGALAVSEEIADKIELGDHGGTYCGNPLGCAVSYAVIKELIKSGVSQNVKKLGDSTMETLRRWQAELPRFITDVRGKGLLIAMEISGADEAGEIYREALEQGLLINVTQGNIIRLFPALNINAEQMEEGLEILKKIVFKTAG